MNAYSKDLRLRVLDAVERGLLRGEVSELFGVSRSTIKRWAKRRREGEDLEPKRSTGRRRRILATAEEKRALWKQLQENDEATLERHCELWEGARGVRVSLATLDSERHPNRTARHGHGEDYPTDPAKGDGIGCPAHRGKERQDRA